MIEGLRNIVRNQIGGFAVPESLLVFYIRRLYSSTIFHSTHDIKENNGHHSILFSLKL